MATVASGIDETSNVVQLNGFFGKRFYFYNLFSQSATLPVYLFNLCLYLSISCQSAFFYLTIFQRWIFFKDLVAQLTNCWIFQGLIHTGSLFLESKAWVCFEATRLSNKTGVIFHIL